MSKMNKPLANYYHEARAQVKKLKTMQEENKKRAERRAEIIAPVAADPLQNLFISGTSCKVLRGAESHAMNEAGENLVPWNGQQDNMIDRFDVRALLDFYKEPDPRVLAARQKSNEALKLEQTLRFESYRDLVRLAARGLSEAQGLATVDAESLDRRAAQHAALQAATDAVYFNPKPGAAGGPGTAAHGAAPAGSGVYSAMGFSYDASAAGPARAAGAAATPAAAAAAADSSDSSSDDESDDDSEDEVALTGCGAGGLAGPVSEADLAQEAEDERVDDMAEAYGLADFSYRLHRSLEKEGEEEARMRKRPKKNMSRKKAANRAKRMTGMGLDPSTGLPLHQHNPYKDPRALINPWQDSRAAGNASPDRPHHRRGSPDYEAGGWRVRERSPTPPRPGEKQYITEFVSSDAAGAAGDGFMGGSNSARPGIIEALPDRPDPAMLGGIQPVARGVMTLQGIKRGDLHMRLKMAAEEDDMPAYRRRSPTPPPRRRASSRSRSRSPGRRRLSSRSRSRSRSGSRERHRRGGDRDRDRRARHRSRSQSRSRSRSRDRDRHRRTNEKDRDRRSRRSSRSRSRSRSRDRRQRRSSDCGGSRHPGSSGKAAGGSYSSDKGAAAAGASSRAGAAVGGGGSAAAKVSAGCWRSWMLQMQHSRTRAGTEGATHAQLQRCSVQSVAVLPCCAPVWALHHIVWLLSLARVACDLSSPQLQEECTCLLIVEPRIAVHRLLCLQCMASAVVLNAGLRQGKVSGHLAAVLSPHVASCALVVALAVRLSCAAGQRCCGCSRAQGERPGAAQAADAGSAEQGSAKGLAGQCAEEDTGLCCW